ncbi:MAG: pyridoxamine 5'-phosphate oxidase family protein [Treponema sp.]|nr:pyridoxamine 5'-phosphate oxidase family protein [Treponema sp.]
MENIDYETELEKIYNQIGEARIMPLATSSKDHTTVRMMSCINYKNKIIFQTGTDLLKYKQICENNNVALCVDNIQIEGTAHIIGSWLKKENKEMLELYLKHYGKSYETYSKSDKEIAIEIIPVQIIKWEYENGRPYRIFINLTEKTIKQETYILE